jgi:hypothetical protein
LRSTNCICVDTSRTNNALILSFESGTTQPATVWLRLKEPSLDIARDQTQLASSTDGSQSRHRSQPATSVNFNAVRAQINRQLPVLPAQPEFAETIRALARFGGCVASLARWRRDAYEV